MKILWVEDNERFVNSARHFLGGHEVTVATTLGKARELLRNRAFDVLLLDYDLPDGKGDELAREWGGKMSVVAVSSHEVGNAALLAAGARVACSKMRFREVAQWL